MVGIGGVVLGVLVLVVEFGEMVVECIGIMWVGVGVGSGVLVE